MPCAVLYYLVLGLLPVLLVSAVSSVDGFASSLDIASGIQSLHRGILLLSRHRGCEDDQLTMTTYMQTRIALRHPSLYLASIALAA